MEVVKSLRSRRILENGYLLEAGSIIDLITDPHSRLSKAFFPPIQEALLDPEAIQAPSLS